jgi:hypothetical protein
MMSRKWKPVNTITAGISVSEDQVVGYQKIRKSRLKIDVFIRVNSWFLGFIRFEKTNPIQTRIYLAPRIFWGLKTNLKKQSQFSYFPVAKPSEHALYSENTKSRRSGKES